MMAETAKSPEATAQPLVVIGAGGHGRETLDIVEAINRERLTWKFLGFLADGEQRPDLSKNRGATILGSVRDLQNFESFFTIGIGLGTARKEIDAFATALGKQSPVLIHPSSVIGSEVQLQPGCVLAAGTMISTNVHIGRHTHIDLASSISHDVTIGDYCTICPGVRVAGWVQIEDGVTVGIGAVLRDRIRIGKDAVIGAGSVVIDDVPAGLTVAGVPAKPLRHQRT